MNTPPSRHQRSRARRNEAESKPSTGCRREPCHSPQAPAPTSLRGDADVDRGVVYTQLAYGATDSVDVSLLSCTLPAKLSKLCRAIEGDFLVRNTPTYIAQNSG